MSLSLIIPLVYLGFSAAHPAQVTLVAPSSPVPTLRATILSQYSVWTGAIRFNTRKGKIFKDGTTSDITTLLTFHFPSSSVGRTCKFYFVLGRGSTASGSRQFDVFRSNAPAPGDTAGWPPGNQRGPHLARLEAANSGQAKWVDGPPNSIKSFPCPIGTWAAELVGVGDKDNIQWSDAAQGPYFTF